MNFFTALREVFISPRMFFKAIEKDTDYLRPWLFFSGFLAVVTIISSVGNIMLQHDEFPKALAAVFVIFALLFNIGWAFAVPFVHAGIFHLGLLILGAKQGYYNTFKPVAYSGLIYTTYVLIIAIVGLLFLPQMQALSDIEEPTIEDMGPSLTYILIVLVVYLVMLAHWLTVATIGVAKFQQISHVRAFFGIIIVPLIIFFMIMLFAVALGIGIVALANSGATGMITGI